MTRIASLALVHVLLIAACGDDNNSHKDAPTGDGPCGASVFFTGELVDWDSTETNFCGVFMAKFTVHGTSMTVSTNPNGRFELCLGSAPTTQIDIMPPANSVCAAGGNYAIPGIAIANKATIATGKLYSARTITTTRVMRFYTLFGLGYDPTKGGVFVHVEGTPKPVFLAGAHDTPLVFDGGAWSAGNAGKNVFFPNVTVPGNPTAAVVTAGGAIGEGAVPIVANTFTYVTIVEP